MIVDKKGQVQGKKGRVVCPKSSYHTGHNTEKGQKGQQFSESIKVRVTFLYRLYLFLILDFF